MDKLHVPKRYLPQMLSKNDTKKQKRYLRTSRKLYKKGIYYQRPNVKSFKSNTSSHIEKAKRMYNINTIRPSQALARKTQCSQSALRKIVNKGRGAYYSSGSRPNQTAESWGLARLASAITHGNASRVDYDILKKGCRPSSRALRGAKRPPQKTRKNR